MTLWDWIYASPDRIRGLNVVLVIYAVCLMGQLVSDYFTEREQQAWIRANPELYYGTELHISDATPHLILSERKREPDDAHATP